MCETPADVHGEYECLYLWLLLIDSPGEYEWKHESYGDGDEYQVRSSPDYLKTIFPDEPNEWEADWWRSGWETRGPDWCGPWAQAGGYIQEMKASIYPVDGENTWEVTVNDESIIIKHLSPTLAVFKAYLIWKDYDKTKKTVVE